MSDIEKLLKNVALGTIGAAATVVEKSGELVQYLIDKGEATVRENKEFTDELTRKGKEVVDHMAESMRNAVQDAAARNDAEEEEDPEENLDEAEEPVPEAETEEDATEEDEPTYSVDEEEANG